MEYYIIFSIVLVFGIASMIFIIWYSAKIKNDYIKLINELKGGVKETTPGEIFEIKKHFNKNLGIFSIPDEYNFIGVYIIVNKSRDLYYIGQSVRVFNRVTAQFRGKGNKDVYSDYQKGDKFIIKFKTLENSEYRSLLELKKATIKEYQEIKHNSNNKVIDDMLDSKTEEI